MMMISVEQSMECFEREKINLKKLAAVAGATLSDTNPT
jgi:hypothetical protein